MVLLDRQLSSVRMLVRAAGGIDVSRYDHVGENYSSWSYLRVECLISTPRKCDQYLYI